MANFEQAYEPKPNSGALFANNNKKAENHPDIRGDIFVSRELIAEIAKKNPSPLIKLSLSVWKRESQAGNKYMSISVSEPYEKGAAPAPAKTSENPWD